MEYARVKDLGKIVTGNTPPTSKPEYYGDFMPFIKATDIPLNSKYTLTTEQSYSEAGYKKYKESLIPKGSTCVVTIGSIGKKLTYAHTDLFVNQAINAIIPNSLFDNGYVFYLSKYAILPQLKIFDSGTTSGRENVSKSSFSNIRIPVIKNKDCQYKIATILSAYDNLIENNNRRIRLLEQMAENLYKEWFVRFRFPGHEKAEFENGLPKGWKVEKVKNIVKRLPFNRTYKEYELEKEGAVIVIDQSTDELMGYHNNEPSHYANYDEPLLLFGDHSCKFQLMTRNFSLGENVIPYTAKNKNDINAYWLFYATHKLIQTEEYKRHWGRFTSMKVLVPDIDVQTRFEKIVKTIEMEKNKLITVNSTLSRQRDLLLPRLMSGKLEVKV